MEYNFTISHKENSDAHVVNVEVLWMLPVYTKFLEVTKNTNQLVKVNVGNNVVFKVRNSTALFYVEQLDRCVYGGVILVFRVSIAFSFVRLCFCAL